MRRGREEMENGGEEGRGGEGKTSKERGKCQNEGKLEQRWGKRRGNEKKNGERKGRRKTGISDIGKRGKGKQTKKGRKRETTRKGVKENQTQKRRTRKTSRKKSNKRRRTGKGKKREKQDRGKPRTEERWHTEARAERSASAWRPGGRKRTH